MRSYPLEWGSDKNRGFTRTGGLALGAGGGQGSRQPWIFGSNADTIRLYSPHFSRQVVAEKQTLRGVNENDLTNFSVVTTALVGKAMKTKQADNQSSDKSNEC